jgi:hypothetical protein
LAAKPEEMMMMMTVTTTTTTTTTATELREVEWEGVTQDRDEWLIFVNLIISFQLL